MKLEPDGDGKVQFALLPVHYRHRYFLNYYLEK
jgi:hypothetical protein